VAGATTGGFTPVGAFGRVRSNGFGGSRTRDRPTDEFSEPITGFPDATLFPAFGVD
jgi:hypothetical protein